MEIPKPVLDVLLANIVHIPRGRGGVIDFLDYVQRKLIDHTEWVRITPRNITPMNIDWSVDNGLSVLEGELSSTTSNWRDLKDGQHTHLRVKVRNGKGLTTAVLCKHRIPKGIFTDSIQDVVEFTAMYYDPNANLMRDNICYQTYGQKDWVPFLVHWFATGDILPAHGAVLMV